MAENSISIKNACIYSGIKERSYYYRNKKNNSKKHIKHRISDEIINGNRLGGKTTYGYTRIWALLRE